MCNDMAFFQDISMSLRPYQGQAYDIVHVSREGQDETRRIIAGTAVRELSR